MHVYALNEPIDCPDIMMSAAYFLKHLEDRYIYPVSKEEVIKEMEEVEELFTSVGWEGDGELKIMWMPPFLQGGTEDNFGDFVYFIKQENNGSTFVCSHYPLPIPQERLFR